MTQKERSLTVLRTLFQDTEGDKLDKVFIIEKIDACLDLERPEVLLGLRETGDWNNLVSQLRQKGKIL